MATFTKTLLSGSTNGRPILVVATTSPGTAVHTAVSGSSSLDEVWLYAHNSSSASVKLTVEYGGVSAPTDVFEINVGAEGTGLVLVCPGVLLQNSLLIKAYAASASVVTLTGYVNRIA